MNHWSTDTTELEKDREAYALWELEHKINYGLRGEKLSRKQLVALWDKLELDPDSKKFLEFILWPQTKQPTS